MVDTVAGVAMQRAGFVKGRQGLMFAVCWWIATAELGRSPDTVEEYAEWWDGRSRSQAFRDQAAFRQCFPEFATPTELAAAVGLDFTDLHRGREAATVAELFCVVMA
jgi:hypothetical protein